MFVEILKWCSATMLLFASVCSIIVFKCSMKVKPGLANFVPQVVKYVFAVCEVVNGDKYVDDPYFWSNNGKTAEVVRPLLQDERVLFNIVFLFQKPLPSIFTILISVCNAYISWPIAYQLQTFFKMKTS